MKKTLKSLFVVFTLAVLCAALIFGVFTAGAVSDDPADSYVKQNAEYEDAGIDLWFEHSFKKVFTSDTTPSGMETYSVYMAKNEVENAQFVLYSDTTKAGLTASVTAFENEAGDTIPAELYYEMYVTTTDLREDFVLGAGAGDSIIREGETPDPVVPLKNIGAFQLNGGKSQAFFIKLRSAEDTPSGWYSAQLDIKNSKGQVVKTATVFAYVWDFTISEETALRTSFFIDNDTGYGGSYKNFYDYLLDNRLLGMDVPGTLSSANAYLTNPRVNAIRVTGDGAGNVGNYGDVNSTSNYSKYTAIYNELYNSKIWNQVKDKFYFYTADEPVGDVWAKWCGNTNPGADRVNFLYDALEKTWKSPMSVVPFHENHPYPYFTYSSPIQNYSTAEVHDAIQAMIDGGGISIWCPQFYAFTPQSELTAAGYTGMETEPIRELSASISGLYSWGDNNSATGTNGVDFFVGHQPYYNWNNIYGEFSDRIQSELKLAEENGSVANSELWAYSAGWNKTYTYANHLIENTGLQTKMLFWQLYQNDITGYLYYGTNNWNEYNSENGNYADRTVTGAWGTDEDTAVAWKTNKHIYPNTGAAIHGNGVLFYGAFQGSIWNNTGVVGTLRVEIMRDGVEDYQMLTMLEDYLGETAAKNVVARVSKNVVNYLSLNNFSTSEWDSSMSEYDIMASVRRDLGNTLEAAVVAGKCDHSYDDGKVTVEATCLKVGKTLYTCKKCGAEKYEVIPALHSEGSCFEVVSGTAATCLADGKQLTQCTVCGMQREKTTTAFHNDAECLRYESKSAAVHNIICNVCNEIIDTASHTNFEINTATCTEAGELQNVCLYCEHTTVVEETEAKGHNLVESKVEPTCTVAGYQGLACTNCDYTEATELPAKGHGESLSEKKDPTCDADGYDRVYCADCGETISEVIIPAAGHKFANGTCAVCGAADPDWVEPEYTLGDINGDGSINGKDSNQLKQILSGATVPTEIEQKAADIKADGAINGIDANLLSQFLAGAIGGF
ncbi:MAG: DUF4091 domain-containing protein [Clostridia bacterium]|nr:DUF4091 domain-containing protein [Clostridia bacterium]